MDRIVVCHCEDITLEELRSAVEQGYGDLETLKRFTGLGTGPCQGKRCLVQAIRWLARSQPARTLAFPTVRPPVVPVRIDALRDVRKEEER
jgi:sarcosine oxidase subunit beta